MNRGSAILVSMFLASAPALAEGTPVTLLRDVPDLPKTAKGARCEAGQAIQGQALEGMQADMKRAQQLAMTPARSGRVTDAQAAALDGMNDPRWTRCLIEVPMQIEPMVRSLEQRLHADMEKLEEAKRQDEKACGPSGKGADTACFARVSAAYPPKALEVANAFLRRARDESGVLRANMHSCLSLRESIINGIQGAGVAGPIAMQAVGSRAESWRMPAALAGTHDDLCRKAVEAAARFDPVK